MNKYGFYISKLEVSGLNTKAARLEFEPGLNILTGLSDTGKSYVFACINFMLGGGDSPKDIPEADGYSDAYLEIKTYTGKTYTLYRKLSGGDFRLNEEQLNYFGTRGNITTIKSQHAGKNDNISSFLLGLSGLEGKYVKKDKYNTKRELSYRDIAKLTLIDEERIITEKSPLYSGQFTEQPQEQSVLKILLTGVDAKDLQQIEDVKVYTSRIKGKLELIDSLIKETSERIEKLEAEFSEQKQVESQKRLEELTKVISDTSVKLNELMAEQKSYFNQINELESKQLLQDEILDRFKLLKEHYQNDIKRLEFVTEGESYLSQLNTIKCPLCEGDMDKNHYDCLIGENQKQASVVEAVGIEIQKINLKLNDLISTVTHLEVEKTQRKTEIEALKKKRTDVNLIITKEIEPIRSSAKQEFDTLLTEQGLINNRLNLKNSLSGYYAQKSIFDQELKKKPKPEATDENIELAKYIELSSFIETILRKWQYPNLSTVNFDSSYKLFDIVINNKNRKAHGKGIRAITYSAFIIGLMNYCIEKKLPHPYNIIIDSPLTTYQGQEENATKEEISMDMQNAFFDDLSNLSKDRQIIIIDNKEPNSSLQNKINYIHFTGDKTVGRVGFFPKS